MVVNEEMRTITNAQKVLDWAYDKAVNGIAGADSAQDMAMSYMKKGSNTVDCVNALIRTQNAKACVSGFVLGLGGGITLPVTLPVSITSVMFIQIRMIAAIAYMGGHCLHEENVRSFVYLCLCGNAAKDVLKEAGIRVGMSMAQRGINTLSGEMLKSVNQAVGARIIARMGRHSGLHFLKLVPLTGGVIGGVFDGVSTNIIGNIAREAFID